MTDVVLPIRLMKRMGAKSLLLTNAAGGIQQGMRAGDLMLITGQISSFVPSPLIGENVKELGTRFPDMSEIYDKKLQKMICRAATGPQYESPEEIAMFRILGADAVGMSTACEAIAARHMGMRVAGISCISNLAAGISPEPLSHEEVGKAADEAAPRFQRLVYEAVSRMREG